MQYIFKMYYISCVNKPQSELYDKGLTLFDAAREEAHRTEVLEQIELRGGSPTLKRVRRPLMEIRSEAI